jgi:hypothetical protein
MQEFRCCASLADSSSNSSTSNIYIGLDSQIALVLNNKVVSFKSTNYDSSKNLLHSSLSIDTNCHLHSIHTSRMFGGPTILVLIIVGFVIDAYDLVQF